MAVQLTLSLARREDRDTIAEALSAHAETIFDHAAQEAAQIMADHRAGQDGRSRSLKLVHQLALADELTTLAQAVREAEVSS